MRCVEWVAAIRRAAFALMAGGILAVSAASNAWASAGCDAVNNGELNVSSSNSTPMAWRTITGKRFSPGDVLTTTSRTNDGTLNYVYLVFLDGSQRRAEATNPLNYSTFTLTAAGNESGITAYIYNGGSGGNANWITVACTPGPANASLTEIQTTPNPSSAGQSVSFTATVTGTASNGTPNGTVTINFGDGTSTPVTLSGGTATTTHTYTTAGSKSVTANYSGDGTNYVASSGSLTQTVNKVAGSPSLNITPSPGVAGQASTFSVTVSGASGVPTPTGTVTLNFGDGSPQAVLTLSSGTASTTHTYAAAAHFTTALTYSGDTNYTGTTINNQFTAGQATSGTSLGSSANPSPFGLPVTFTATVTGLNPAGIVQFFDSAALIGSGTLGSGQATLTTSALTPGPHSITAVYSGDSNNNSSTSPVLIQTISLSSTTTALASSKNPSDVGQPVTFTATVTSAGGTPPGSVTFTDGSTTLGTVALSGGVATLTTAALTLGTHSITASFSGSPGFTSGTSSPLVQSVNIPADSLKLRALQAMATPVVSQFSGQAISGAIDNAIAEGFSDGGGSLVSPNNSGIRFNFAADSSSDDPKASSKVSSAAPFGTTSDNSRVNDAFGALAYAGPIKAPKSYVEPRDWLGWAEVRGATLERWSAGGTGASTTLYGNQINVTAGLTRKLAPNFLIGALGGYETFDYRSDQLQGRMKGDGWTVGSYLGWKITQTIRFDAAVGYSGLGYDGTAGTASGSFTGNRWLVSGGLTGTYESHGLMIEPSARVYALWEHENAYTDTLGTVQSARDFTTGRASGGLRLAYPVMWSSVAIAPYVGLYGDYYFNGDSAAVPAGSLATVSAAILDGWSARAAGGANLKFTNGAQISVGAERGGIGSSSGAALWTYRARASVPF